MLMEHACHADLSPVRESRTPAAAWHFGVREIVLSGRSSAQGRGRVTLAIGGMTCGACVARVERALNELEGATAHVNYASELATVELAAELAPAGLIERLRVAGYTAEVVDHGPEGAVDPAARLQQRARSLRRRLLVAAALFIPLCDLSILFSVYPTLRFEGWQWLMVTLAAPVIIWAALPFYAAAVRSARRRRTTMDTLVSIGILAATAWSLYSMFFLDASAHGSLIGLGHGSGGGIYLDVPAGVITFLLAGRYFEAWSRQRSGNALRELAALGAREVTVLDSAGCEQRRPIASLAVGERFVVRPGETVASDGEVVLGQAAVDRSVMTGESMPVDVVPGDCVLGGTVSLTGRLVVQAAKVGAETQLGQMMRLVQDAQGEKAEIQRLADRISSVFVPAVLLVALGTLIAWLATGSGTGVAISAAVSVLIIACPCALGLATPAALLVASWAGARLGIFFKGYHGLEVSRRIDTVVLDKTGTITEGQMALVDLHAVAGVQPRTLLRLAGAVELASEHPVARAIVAEARHWVGELPQVDAFVAISGVGAKGTVDRRELYVGRAGSDERPEQDVDPGLSDRCREWERLGRTVVVVRREQTLIGALALADAIRPSAASAVRQLEALGLRCVLVTGDNETTARAVAASVGIDEVFAGALPTEKVAIIRRLQGEGRCVAMVGDGVNDAPALAAADLGVAVGSGTDAAINAADVIVVREDLRVAASAIALARRTLRTIRGNLAWAFLYNLAAIPLAALGLLDPLIAAAAMGLSSSFVVWNSSSLRRLAARPAGAGPFPRTDSGPDRAHLALASLGPSLKRPERAVASPG
jgi:P-type Cu+ transporter